MAGKSYAVKKRRHLKLGAQRRKIHFKLTIDDVNELLAQAKCHWCRTFFQKPSEITVDRIDHLGGYTPNNVCASCKDCNHRRDYETRKQGTSRNMEKNLNDGILNQNNIEEALTKIKLAEVVLAATQGSGALVWVPGQSRFLVKNYKTSAQTVVEYADINRGFVEAVGLYNETCFDIEFVRAKESGREVSYE